MNERLTRSWDVLRDRAMGPESYEACPSLARFLNLAVSISQDDGRRRLQASSVRPGPLQLRGASVCIDVQPFLPLQCELVASSVCFLVAVT